MQSPSLSSVHEANASHSLDPPTTAQAPVILASISVPSELWQAPVPGPTPIVHDTAESDSWRLEPLQPSQKTEAPQLFTSLNMATAQVPTQYTTGSQQSSQRALSHIARVSAVTAGDSFNPIQLIPNPNFQAPASLPRPPPPVKWARSPDVGPYHRDSLYSQSYLELRRDGTMRSNQQQQYSHIPGLTPVHPPKTLRKSVNDCTQSTNLTVRTRIEPTIRAAQLEHEKSLAKAKISGLVLNIIIGLQIILGALTTALSAVATTGSKTAVQTTVLGALTTIIGSLLARARGSGEPHLSQNRVKELDKFIREVDAFDLDRGDELDNDTEIEGFRMQLEQILVGHTGHAKTTRRKPCPAANPYMDYKGAANDIGEKKLAYQPSFE